MTNLFSIFDPTSRTLAGISLKWVSAVLFIFILPSRYWLLSGAYLSIFQVITKTLRKEFFRILGHLGSPGLSALPISLILFVGANNFAGLLPFVFTASAHFIFSLRAALPLWLGINALSWVKQPRFIVAHLVPLGTPLPLAPFIVYIEAIRNFIRPLTLAIRLAANMVAGHLILVLISAQCTTVSLFILIRVALLALLVLEIAVRLIQAYVFATLYLLYCDEVNTLAI